MLEKWDEKDELYGWTIWRRTRIYRLRRDQLYAPMFLQSSWGPQAIAAAYTLRQARNFGNDTSAACIRTALWIFICVILNIMSAYQISRSLRPFEERGADEIKSHLAFAHYAMLLFVAPLAGVFGLTEAGLIFLLVIFIASRFSSVFSNLTPVDRPIVKTFIGIRLFVGLFWASAWLGFNQMAKIR